MKWLIRITQIVSLVLICSLFSLPGMKQVSAAGWLGTWQHRIEITIDHTKIDSSLTNFPVMLKISSDSGIGSRDVSAVFDELTSDANRKKIAVTTANGTTQCYIEIVRWDDADELAYLYVKVPAVSSSADTHLYLYYDSTHADNTTYVGDTGSTPAQNVWDANYVSVHHFAQSGNGTAGEYKDSTANGHNGQGGSSTGKGNPTLVTDSQFGYAQSFDGNNDYLFLPDNDAYSIITTLDLEVEFWWQSSTLEWNI